MNNEIRDFIGTSATTLTTTPTKPVSRTCIVEYLAFYNNSGSDITVTVQDGSGKTFYAQPSGAPTGQLTSIDIPLGGLLFSNGVSWFASVGGQVDAWIRARYS